MPRFVLIHSPLVGPSCWAWVAERLTAQGHETSIVSVPPHVGAQGWSAFASAAAGQVTGEAGAVLVGHSGAGPLLPSIRARAHGGPFHLVFVDAGVPPETGPGRLMPEDMLAELQEMADEGGLLPPWSEWFGPGVVEDLVPDRERREAVIQDLPRLPVAYFQECVDAVEGWGSVRCGYVQLSDAYQADAAEARRRGWPVVALGGKHLDLVTRAGEVAAAIVSVVPGSPKGD